MTNNLRPILFLLILLFSVALFLLVAAYFTHIEYLFHLSAIFVELFFSVIIIEIFFENNRRQETFRIYNIARNYVLYTLFLPFTKTFTLNLQNTDFIDSLGQYPSFHPKILQEQTLNKLAQEILTNFNDQMILELLQVIQLNFLELRNWANSNVVAHNTDLLSSATVFSDTTYAIWQINSRFNQTQILAGLKGEVDINNGVQTLEELFLTLIRTWLYIINNFLYFSDMDKNALKARMRNRGPLIS